MNGVDANQLAATLGMDPRHVRMVIHTLENTVPGRQVWAFGSRATGRHLKIFSDLDLAVEGALTWCQRGMLAENFDESLLPIKVDIVELAMVDTEFAERIRRDFVLVQAAMQEAAS